MSLNGSDDQIINGAGRVEFSSRPAPRFNFESLLRSLRLFGSFTATPHSEFRFRGTNGATDEFIELYNQSDQAVGITRLVGCLRRHGAPHRQQRLDPCVRSLPAHGRALPRPAPASRITQPSLCSTTRRTSQPARASMRSVVPSRAPKLRRRPRSLTAGNSTQPSSLSRRQRRLWLAILSTSSSLSACSSKGLSVSSSTSRYCSLHHPAHSKR